MYITTTYYPNYISHHGILGMKWGIRRYQNEDGSYTDAGLKRRAKEYKKILNKSDAKATRATARLASLQRSKTGYFSPEKRFERKSFKNKLTKVKMEKDGTARVIVPRSTTRLLKKVAKRDIREKELTRVINDNNKVIKDTLNKCKNEGYDYAVRKVQRYSWADFSLSEGYYQSAYGNKFRVKPSSDKTKKSAYWQTNRNVKFNRTPIRTDYYYY